MGTLPAAALAESVPDSAADSAYAGFTPDELYRQWQDIGALLRANGLYPFTALEKGDVGYEVTALQTRLAELGYYTKAVVDNYGTGTYNAMREFEKANGLKVNGKASAADQKVLFGSAAVAYTKSGTKTSRTNSSSDTNDATSSATP